MHIVILQGSPNAKGSTALMVEEFSRGAREAGHDVLRVDVDRLQVRPCTGCVACGYEGPCAVHDDMQDLRAKILAADMVVFATPLYYYGMSAQLKTVIDRFCSFNASLTRKQVNRCSSRWRGMPMTGPSMRSMPTTARSCGICRCKT